MKHIAIVGSGISGLATAYALLEKGFEVTILARHFPPGTTSNKAAAFWFPYHIRNDQRGVEWCQASYEKYRKLCSDPSTGISMHQLVKVIPDGFDEGEANWINFMPPGSYRVMKKNELSDGFYKGYDTQVPLIETQLFLPWLMNYLKQNGVEFIQQPVNDLSSLSTTYDFVINCTALGSRELCDDRTIYPLRGQIALIAPVTNIPIYLDNEQDVYVVPRQDATIIGGTYEKDVWEEATDEGTIQRLHRQASKVFPQLENVPVTGSWSGLRPFRHEVRLEREQGKNIIHNYGHGGSGFTLAWGCANEVVHLIEQDNQ